MSDVLQFIRAYLRDGGQASERDMLAMAADAIERLERELAQCREDAERYRWLRHGDNDELVLAGAYVGVSFLLRNEKLYAAIDAARASTQSPARESTPGPRPPSAPSPAA